MKTFEQAVWVIVKTALASASLVIIVGVVNILASQLPATLRFSCALAAAITSITCSQ